MDQSAKKEKPHRESGVVKTLTKPPGAETEQLDTGGSIQSQLKQVQDISLRQQPNLSWRKGFKIVGQIGEPDQRDKLTYSSLAHQIENGLKRGYPEAEIVDAVIRAISPGLQLRSYLEGKPDLTLPILRCILHSHFQEKSVTECKRDPSEFFNAGFRP